MLSVNPMFFFRLKPLYIHTHRRGKAAISSNPSQLRAEIGTGPTLLNGCCHAEPHVSFFAAKVPV